MMLKKKEIGLFLSSEPNCGGVYQYSLSIIESLETLDPEMYHLRCFFFDDQWKSQLPARFEQVLIKLSFVNQVFAYFIRKILKTPQGWRFSGRFNEGALAINASDCDVVIYPSQDGQAYQTNKKSIVAIHDLMHKYEPHFEEYQGKECVNRDIHYSAISKYSDVILTDSNVGREHVLESYNVDEKKVKVLPFVPPYYLSESNKENIRDSFELPEKFIFYPAQFWEHKNHVNLLEALKILRDNGEEVNIVLVGAKKNTYEKVLAKIKELGLTDSVFVLGYVSNGEMLSLYKEAVAMVFVSLIGPTNIPPMEALVTGCPLICSNAYAMPEQVGRAARLVDSKDPQDIAKEICSVWNSKQVRQALVLEGYEKVKQYTQRDFSLLLGTFIEEVVNDSSLKNYNV